MLGVILFVVVVALVTWQLGYPHLGFADLRKSLRMIVGRVRANIASMTWTQTKHAAATNYIQITLVVSLLLLALALYFGGMSVPGIVSKQISNLGKPENSAEDVRSYAYAFGALLAAIALFFSIPLQVIRMWISERQTHTAEQGLATDRIQKAVEQLGAEKVVKRIALDKDGNEVRKDNGAPEILETSEPNLEVRIGGIYALGQIAGERIAKGHYPDFISILETLCAYIRNNAQAKGAIDNPYGEWESIKPGTPVQEVTAYLTLIHNYAGIKRSIDNPTRFQQCETWASGLSGPRMDIDAALKTAVRLWSKRKQTGGVPIADLRLDLSNANMQKVDLSNLDLSDARLSGSRLEGALLIGTNFSGANMNDARLDIAELGGAVLEGSLCNRTSFVYANLEGATIKGAVFGSTIFQSAALDKLDFSSTIFNFSTNRFECASLKNADFSYSYVYGSFDGAKLVGAKFIETNIFTCSFNGARLDNADFRITDFSSIALVKAYLKNTDFRLALLDSANLSEAS